MNKVKFTVLAIVAAFATTAAASDIEFHGYTRAGIGLAATGGAAVCFHLAGADTDYRLGNECDYVIEPELDYTIAKLEDKSEWGVTFMPAMYRGWATRSQAQIDASIDGQLNLTTKQFFFFGRNIPQLLNGEVWVGRRYWDRVHIDPIDQFLENEDGDGGGVANMDVGIGKLTISWMQNPNDESNSYTVGGVAGSNTANNALYKLTAHLDGIQTFNKGSNLMIWAGYYGQSRGTIISGGASTDTKPDEVKATYRIAAYHTWDLGGAGTNFLFGKLVTSDAAKTWRIGVTHAFTIMNGGSEIDLVAEYRNTKPKDQDANTWFTIGGRGDFRLVGPFRLVGELGYDTAKTGSADATNLVKGTVAFEVAGGGSAGSRPVIRAFYTYASWNDAAKTQGAMGGRTNAVFGDKTSGGSYGLQAEAWW